MPEATPQELTEPRVWQVGTGPHTGRWTCLACGDGRWRDFRSACRHQDTSKHQSETEFYIQSQYRTLTAPASTRSLAEPSPNPAGPLDTILRSLASGSTPVNSLPSPTPGSNNSPGEFTLDFDALGSDRNFSFEDAPDSVAGTAASLQDWLANGSASDGSSSSDDEQPEVPQEFEPTDPLAMGSQRTRALKNLQIENPDWYPWPDKETCVLDILHHLPRSMFSDAQMETILGH